MKVFLKNVGRLRFRRKSQLPLSTIEEDGGVRDNTDHDAPKTISSTLIISFDCRFSTMDADPPGEMGNHIYHLLAKLENGAVKGSYQVLDTGEKRLFRASHVFLRRVRHLIERYDFARYNGLSFTVQGLPDDYGACLQIVYASGERIYACNNQDNFLPPAAISELITLFTQG